MRQIILFSLFCFSFSLAEKDLHADVGPRDYKGYGAQHVVPVKGIAVFTCDDEFSSGSICGNVTFEQEHYPYTPVVVEFNLEDIEPGDYRLHIHFYGDLTDGCESTGKRFHIMRKFSVTDGSSGRFWDAYLDYHISILDPMKGIAGRSVVVAKMTSDRRYDDRVSCAVIGISDELIYAPINPIAGPTEEQVADYEAKKSGNDTTNTTESTTFSSTTFFTDTTTENEAALLEIESATQSILALNPNLTDPSGSLISQESLNRFCFLYRRNIAIPQRPKLNKVLEKFCNSRQVTTVPVTPELTEEEKKAQYQGRVKRFCRIYMRSSHFATDSRLHAVITLFCTTRIDPLSTTQVPSSEAEKSDAMVKFCQAYARPNRSEQQTKFDQVIRRYCKTKVTDQPVLEQTEAVAKLNRTVSKEFQENMARFCHLYAQRQRFPEESRFDKVIRRFCGSKKNETTVAKEASKLDNKTMETKQERIRRFCGLYPKRILQHSRLNSVFRRFCKRNNASSETTTSAPLTKAAVIQQTKLVTKPSIIILNQGSSAFQDRMASFCRLYELRDPFPQESRFDKVIRRFCKGATTASPVEVTSSTPETHAPMDTRHQRIAAFCQLGSMRLAQQSRLGAVFRRFCSSHLNNTDLLKHTQAVTEPSTEPAEEDKPIMEVEGIVITERTLKILCEQYNQSNGFPLRPKLNSILKHVCKSNQTVFIAATTRLTTPSVLTGSPKAETPDEQESRKSIGKFCERHKNNKDFDKNPRLKLIYDRFCGETVENATFESTGDKNDTDEQVTQEEISVTDQEGLARFCELYGNRIPQSSRLDVVFKRVCTSNETSQVESVTKLNPTIDIQQNMARFCEFYKQRNPFPQESRFDKVIRRFCKLKENDFENATGSSTVPTGIPPSMESRQERLATFCGFFITRIPPDSLLHAVFKKFCTQQLKPTEVATVTEQSIVSVSQLTARREDDRKKFCLFYRDRNPLPEESKFDKVIRRFCKSSQTALDKSDSAETSSNITEKSMATRQERIAIFCSLYSSRFAQHSRLNAVFRHFCNITDTEGNDTATSATEARSITSEPARNSTAAPKHEAVTKPSIIAFTLEPGSTEFQDHMTSFCRVYDEKNPFPQESRFDKIIRRFCKSSKVIVDQSISTPSGNLSSDSMATRKKRIAMFCNIYDSRFAAHSRLNAVFKRFCPNIQVQSTRTTVAMSSLATSIAKKEMEVIQEVENATERVDGNEMLNSTEQHGNLTRDERIAQLCIRYGNEFPQNSKLNAIFNRICKSNATKNDSRQDTTKNESQSTKPAVEHEHTSTTQTSLISPQATKELLSHREEITEFCKRFSGNIPLNSRLNKVFNRLCPFNNQDSSSGAQEILPTAQTKLSTTAKQLELVLAEDDNLVTFCSRFNSLIPHNSRLHAIFNRLCNSAKRTNTTLLTTPKSLGFIGGSEPKLSNDSESSTAENKATGIQNVQSITERPKTFTIPLTTVTTNRPSMATPHLGTTVSEEKLKPQLSEQNISSGVQEILPTAETNLSTTAKQLELVLAGDGNLAKFCSRFSSKIAQNSRLRGIFNRLCNSTKSEQMVSDESKNSSTEEKAAVIQNVERITQKPQRFTINLTSATNNASEATRTPLLITRLSQEKLSRLCFLYEQRRGSLQNPSLTGILERFCKSNRSIGSVSHEKTDNTPQASTRRIELSKFSLTTGRPDSRTTDSSETSVSTRETDATTLKSSSGSTTSTSTRRTEIATNGTSQSSSLVGVRADVLTTEGSIVSTNTSSSNSANSTETQTEVPLGQANSTTDIVLTSDPITPTGAISTTAPKQQLTTESWRTDVTTQSIIGNTINDSDIMASIRKLTSAHNSTTGTLLMDNVDDMETIATSMVQICKTHANNSKFQTLPSFPKFYQRFCANIPNSDDSSDISIPAMSETQLEDIASGIIKFCQEYELNEHLHEVPKFRRFHDGFCQFIPQTAAENSRDSAFGKNTTKKIKSKASKPEERFCQLYTQHLGLRQTPKYTKIYKTFCTNETGIVAKDSRAEQHDFEEIAFDITTFCQNYAQNDHLHQIQRFRKFHDGFCQFVPKSYDTTTVLPEASTARNATNATRSKDELCDLLEKNPSLKSMKKIDEFNAKFCNSTSFSDEMEASPMKQELELMANDIVSFCQKFRTKKQLHEIKNFRRFYQGFCRFVPANARTPESASTPVSQKDSSKNDSGSKDTLTPTSTKKSKVGITDTFKNSSFKVTTESSRTDVNTTHITSANSTETSTEVPLSQANSTTAMVSASGPVTPNQTISTTAAEQSAVTTPHQIAAAPHQQIAVPVHKFCELFELDDRLQGQSAYQEIYEKYCLLDHILDDDHSHEMQRDDDHLHEVQMPAELTNRVLRMVSESSNESVNTDDYNTSTTTENLLRESHRENDSIDFEKTAVSISKFCTAYERNLRLQQEPKFTRFYNKFCQLYFGESEIDETAQRLMKFCNEYGQNLQLQQRSHRLRKLYDGFCKFVPKITTTETYSKTTLMSTSFQTTILPLSNSNAKFCKIYERNPQLEQRERFALLYNSSCKKDTNTTIDFATDYNTIDNKTEINDSDIMASIRNLTSVHNSTTAASLMDNVDDMGTIATSMVKICKIHANNSKLRALPSFPKFYERFCANIPNLDDNSDISIPSPSGNELEDIASGIIQFCQEYQLNDLLHEIPKFKKFHDGFCQFVPQTTTENSRDSTGKNVAKTTKIERKPEELFCQLYTEHLGLRQTPKYAKLYRKFCTNGTAVLAGKSETEQHDFEEIAVDIMSFCQNYAQNDHLHQIQRFKKFHDGFCQSVPKPDDTTTTVLPEASTARNATNTRRSKDELCDLLEKNPSLKSMKKFDEFNAKFCNSTNLSEEMDASPMKQELELMASDIVSFCQKFRTRKQLHEIKKFRRFYQGFCRFVPAKADTETRESTPAPQKDSAKNVSGSKENFCKLYRRSPHLRKNPKFVDYHNQFCKNATNSSAEEEGSIAMETVLSDLNNFVPSLFGFCQFYTSTSDFELPSNLDGFYGRLCKFLNSLSPNSFGKEEIPESPLSVGNLQTVADGIQKFCNNYEGNRRLRQDDKLMAFYDGFCRFSEDET